MSATGIRPRGRRLASDLPVPGQWVDDTWQDASLGVDLVYNVMRWAETGTGRYTRPDPLGMLGDPHPYTYVQSNPLSYIDPFGLVSWECVAFPELSVGVGVTGGVFPMIECWSECVDNKRARGYYSASGGGVGGTVGVEVSGWDLEDGTSTPDAGNLEGHFGLSNCSVTILFGISTSKVKMGKGTGSWSVGPSFGLGAGCFTISGGVKLVRETEECCETNPPLFPTIGPKP